MIEPKDKLSNKLVSIIIPTYNRGNIIQETINSILNQTYQNFQVFIIDDGSTDNTKKIIHSFRDQRIEYIFQNHSGLPATGRNIGLKKANGDYVAFLDSDDLWFPRKLELQIKLFEKNPEILLIATNGVLFPRKYNNKVLSLKKNTKVSFKQLLEKNIIINSSVLLKKEVIENIGLLDENLKLKYGEDFDYWLRLLRFRDNSILVIKEVLVKYRENKEILFKYYNNPQFFLKKYWIYKQIYEKQKDFNKNHIEKLMRKILDNYKISMIRKEIITKQISFHMILKINFLKVYQKLKLLIEYFIFKFEFPYLIKKIKIFHSKIDYFKDLIFRLFK